MTSILISDTFPEQYIDQLKASDFEVLYNPEITPDQLVAEIPQYDALIVRSRTIVTPEVIAAAKNLKIIGRVGSGVDNIAISEAREKNIIVVNAPGANSQTVAEHTIGLMLALTRVIPATNAEMHKGTWGKKTYSGIELSGKTLGIIGFGQIAQIVARIAVSFGMKLMVYNRTTTGEKMDTLQSLGGVFVSTEELLVASDIVTIHVSKSSETMGMIGKKELELMKSSALLINCARGGMVNETDLVEALQNNVIAGAGLDVFSEEPLNTNSALCNLPHVIMTPHVAAQSPEAQTRAAGMVTADITRVLHGENAEHAV